MKENRCDFCRTEGVETEGNEFLGFYCKDCLRMVIAACEQAIAKIEKRELDND